MLKGANISLLKGLPKFPIVYKGADNGCNAL